MVLAAKNNFQCALSSFAQLLRVGAKKFFSLNFSPKVSVILTRSVAKGERTKKVPEQQRLVGEFVILY